jgi:RNA polymerase sigma-70 factor (ECF subfamily)
MSSLPPDPEVIARVLAGDVEAFGTLVDRYQDEFAGFATQMTGSGDEAADIIQESLVRAYKALRRCRDPANFKGWLFRIVSNQCKTHLARRQRRRDGGGEGTGREPAAPDDPHGALEAAEARERLHAALQALPPDQREALLLKYVEGLSLEEMAERLSASVSALKMRLLRGRAALRGKLEGGLV